MARRRESKLVGQWLEKASRLFLKLVKLAPMMRLLTVRRTVAGLLVAAFLVIGVWLARLYQQTALLIEQRRQALSSAIYSAPLVLQPGADLAQVHFFSRLRHLSYSQVLNVQRAGEYGVVPSGLVIFVRDFRVGDIAFPARKALLSLDGTQVTAILDPYGRPLDRLVLEPEMIGRLMADAPAERVDIPLDELPPYLVNGLLATEDRYFYYHPGFEPIRIVKAAIADLRAGRAVAGASTITQQLARTFLGNRQRSVSRKLREFAIALVLEMRLSKKEILGRYINDVYMGENRGTAIYGMPAAARYLFNKDLREVAPDEAATLIGMIRAPILYDPRRHPELCLTRRNVVLAQMKRAGAIDPSVMARAENSQIILAPEIRSRYAPYFTDYVASIVSKMPQLGGKLAGVRVYTTLDAELQELATESARDNLSRLERQYRRLRRAKAEDRLQTAMVTIDVRSGAIKAMVGGRDYAVSQFNRATSAHRQVGSTFKPFVYLTALDPDRSPWNPPMTLATMLPDRPMSFHGWMPVNYERTYRGEVTVAEALAHSLNVPTAYVGFRLGPQRMINTAHEMGIEEELPAVSSLAIGAGETTLLELTSAYQVFAAGGEAREPYAVVAVIDGAGRLVYHHVPAEHRLISQRAAYLITAALQGVLTYGTGAAARTFGVDFPAAGKTGTTNDYADAYFVGYTPELVCGVWVGFDQPHSMGLNGAQAALPQWASFMAEAWPASHGRFSVPPGITFVTIDPQNGALATPGCPRTLSLPFLSGTAPTTLCPLHAGQTAVARLPSPPAPVPAASTPPVNADDVNGQGIMLTPPVGVVTTIKHFFSALFGH
jgi:penicillin-binding protein 1B